MPSVPSDDSPPALTPDARARLALGALVETSRRVQHAGLMYAVFWLLTCQFGGFAGQFPLLTYGGSAVLLVLGAARLPMHRHILQLGPDGTRRGWLQMRTVTLTQSLTWGLFGVGIVTCPQADALRALYFAVTGALAVGSSMAMSIDRTMRVMAPVLLALPPVLAAAWVGISGVVWWALLTVAAWAWCCHASAILGHDFWSAQWSRLALQQRADALERASLTDPLTRIANRMAFSRQLDEAWSNARRHGHAVSLAILDLDHFKRINDTHGHPVGDAVLHAAAQTLHGHMLRPGDLVARYGGEEFVVLMPQTESVGACQVADRLCSAVRALRIPAATAADGVALTCSVGVATAWPLPADGELAMRRLMQAADDALYLAKGSGRDRVVSADAPFAEQPPVAAPLPAAALGLSPAPTPSRPTQVG